MDLSELLSKAWAAVIDSGVPSEVREIAFKQAIDLLAGSHRTETHDRGLHKPGVLPPDGSASHASPPPHAANDFYSRLAKESGASVDDLRDVFHVEGDEITIIPPGKDLGKDKAAQTRTVALLVVAAREHGLGDSTVSAASVRKTCADKKCFDQNNNAAYLKNAPGIAIIGKGPSASMRTRSNWHKDFVDAVARSLKKAGE